MGNLKAADPSREAYDQLMADDPELGLFTAGGPFESFPGPVLVAGRNGIVLGANTAAEPIAALLQSGGTPELSDAINSALQGQAAQITPLVLKQGKGHKGKGLVYDLIVLPWANAPAALLLARDITLDRSLRAALIESRQRYKDLVEVASDFAWETDRDGRFVFVTEGNALGYAAAELVGEKAHELLVGAVLPEASPFSTKVPLRGVEVWALRKDDEHACLAVFAMPLLDSGGEWCGVRGQCRDTTKQRAHELKLARARHRERLFAYILRVVRDESEPSGMLAAAADELLPALSADGVVIYRQGEDGELYTTGEAGISPRGDIRGLIEGVLESGKDAGKSSEVGRLIVRATRFREVCNGALCVWYKDANDNLDSDEDFLLSEIAEQIAVAHQQITREQELEKISSIDSLTGLLNRRSFFGALERRFERAASDGRQLTLFYIDLDNFKLVNDRHGHQKGDEALVKLGRIFAEQVRGSDLAARLGGDEFGICIDGVGVAIALEKAQALLQATEELAALSGDPEHKLGLSIGIAVFDPSCQETLDSLMARADNAMYAVKRRGKGGLQIAESDSSQGSDSTQGAS